MNMKALVKKVGRRVKRIARRIYYNVYYKLYAKHISIDVGELFFQHNGGGGGYFKRYDMIVRLISVEKYHLDPTYDFDLYYKMQKARMGKEWADKAVGIFKELIKSYDANGYNEKSEILLDKNLNLIDGSHRMALAIYNGCKTISAKVVPENVPVFYQIEWFFINGFSEKECEMLQTRYKELYEQYMKPFVCTLWHPAKPYWEDITKNLALFGKVNEIVDYCLTEDEYKYYTHGIYAVDDIEKWKIEKKFSVMKTDDSNNYYLRMVSLNLDTPEFRLKQTNNKTLSQRCELIKGLIRKGYKDKITNYFHDVIIHIGDNFYQNEYIHRLLTLRPIDVSSILDDISECRYAITKFDVDYMPSDFPQKYPLGKDIDIICLDRDNYLAIKNVVVSASEKYDKEYSIRTISRTSKKDGEYRTLVRYELENQLVFQFDIAYRTGKTREGFEEAMVKEKVKRGNFYVTSPSFEILIRLCEIHDYPHKKHHVDYIMSHKEDIDSNLCDTYLDFNWRKIVGDNVKNINFAKENRVTL